MKYETGLRNKNRRFMKLIMSQKAIQLFELPWTSRIAEEIDDPDFTRLIEHSITSPVHYSITAPLCSHA